MKEIKLSDSVYEICKKYPEVKEILSSLGFEHIIDPAMLNTVGRMMTIPKGSRMKNIEMEKIKEMFGDKGFAFIE